MKKGIIFAIVAAAVGIPVFAYAAGPLFVNNVIDEPLPPGTDGGTMMDKGDEEGMMEDKPEDLKTGNFIGVGDGIHDATGVAKVIPVGEDRILRLEEFRSTNGPDLYVYLSIDERATDFVSLGKLKANIGNQNYEIPEGVDLSRYDTVLIWCQQFSVLFGSAMLEDSVSSA
jgi:hypothetical protein